MLEQSLSEWAAETYPKEHPFPFKQGQRIRLRVDASLHWNCNQCGHCGEDECSMGDTFTVGPVKANVPKSPDPADYEMELIALFPYYFVGYDQAHLFEIAESEE